MSEQKCRCKVRCKCYDCSKTGSGNKRCCRCQPYPSKCSGHGKENCPICPTGPQGPEGPPEPPGEAGSIGTLAGGFDSVQDLIDNNPNHRPGNFYLVGSEVYYWDEFHGEWRSAGNIEGLQGAQGAVGPAGPQGGEGPPGPPGENGTVGTIAGSFDSLEELQNYSYHIPGNFYLVGAHLYFWDAIQNQWTDAGSIEGPPGPQGEKGAIGPLGPEGPQGISGPVGAPGMEGPQGPQGEDGPPGSQGSDGATPEIGDNGNWFINGEDTGILAQGPSGRDGSCLTFVCDGEALGSVRGMGTAAEGDTVWRPSGEGVTYAIGAYATVLNLGTAAMGNNSFAEGEGTIASGESAHAEGYGSEASGFASHTEGYGSEASGFASHTEGYYTEATGRCAHAEGYSSVASALYAHAEGSNAQASGETSHAEGQGTIADGLCSHAEGRYTEVTGVAAHGEGIGSKAIGNYSHAANVFTVTPNEGQTAIGRYNDPNYPNAAFMVGNGIDIITRSNAFRVDFNGDAYASGNVYANGVQLTGADYAEMFEWADGNLDNEDRVGRFVTVKQGKIQKAAAKDKAIIGVVSSKPSMIGDAQSDHWHKKYVTDAWKRPLQEEADIVIGTCLGFDYGSGEVVEVPKIRKEVRPVLNPDFDSKLVYVPRSKRPEWAAIGMIGKLLVQDDGSCVADGYCWAGSDGIATASETGFLVLERRSDEQILVLVK